MASPRQTIIGSSESLHRVLAHSAQLAGIQRPVLIIGERGTGKELIAERLHFLSARWQMPYLQVNCAAMHENLLESELFGHESGAFTGAQRARAGVFERAEGGTLFLDELANASLMVQEKLLRVIEYGQFSRLGAERSRQADVRVIAATHVDLPQAVAAGHFRADLLDRLAFDVIHLPPLRSRPEDIRELAEHFAIRMTRELDRSYFAGFSQRALRTLQEYHWPGNIRELRNVVERSVYRQQDGLELPLDHIVLDPFDRPWEASENPSAAIHEVAQENLMSSSSAEAESVAAEKEPSSFAEAKYPADIRTALAAQEQHWISEALRAQKGHQGRAAEALGLSYHQLRAALRKYPQLNE